MGSRDSFNGPSRYGKRVKRKKTNIILNSLIAIVLVLIMIVVYVIFFGGNNNNAVVEDEQNTHEDKDESSEKAEDDPTTPETEEAEDAPENEEDTQATTPDTMSREDVASTEVVEEGGENDNVIRTITNENWEPIGTIQTGGPSADYQEGNVDWQELEKALRYATGITSSDMTIWFLGNNGEKRAKGKVSNKSQSERYHVYLKWVDDEGWIPEKVEEVKDVQAG